MAINQPDLTGDVGGTRSGISGGPASPTNQRSTAANVSSPQKLLQARWRPRSFLDFHARFGIDDDPDAVQASRDLDTAVQNAYQGMGTLENMIASTQQGQTTVTGTATAIPTGLTSVRQASGSVDNGATPHNFWVSVTPSSTPGCIDITVSKPTAAGNNTPILATTGVKVRWVATGNVSG